MPSMKLLSKKDIKNSKRGELMREAQLASRVLKTSEKARKKLNDDKTVVSRQKELLANSFEEFTQDIQIKKGDMIAEVKELEAKKAAAMIPVTALREEAERLAKENKDRSRQLDMDSRVLEKATQRLHKAQEEHEQLLIDDKARVDDLTALESRVIIREARVKTNENELTSYIKEQHEKNSLRVYDLDLRQQRLDTTEDALDRERDALANLRDDLGRSLRQVEDQRRTLQREFDRLNKHERS